jgi:hypothetical protein
MHQTMEKRIKAHTSLSMVSDIFGQIKNVGFIVAKHLR